MRFAIDFPTSGQFSDPRLLAGLAQDAENAGWDGCFVWDHIQLESAEPVADPWITLAAMALTTTRIRIGTLVTPLFRRNPWKLARETVTLDHLSKGRLILGVGSGTDVFGEISTFGGPLDDRIRAQMLDEGLTVLTSDRPMDWRTIFIRWQILPREPSAIQTSSAAISPNSDLGRRYVAKKTSFSASRSLRRSRSCRGEVDAFNHRCTIA